MQLNPLCQLCQHLLDPPPPLVSDCQHFPNPPPPLGRWHYLWTVPYGSCGYNILCKANLEDSKICCHFWLYFYFSFHTKVHIPLSITSKQNIQQYHTPMFSEVLELSVANSLFNSMDIICSKASIGKVWYQQGYQQCFWCTKQKTKKNIKDMYLMNFLKNKGGKGGFVSFV